MDKLGLTEEDFLDIHNVIYVPGYLSQGTVEGQFKQLDAIGGIFNSAIIEPFSWRSGIFWSTAVENTEKASQDLYDKIRVLSDDQRSHLALIGHSLGGRVVVNTMAKLNKENLKIRQAFLLASAINNNDNNIQACVKTSVKPVVSIYCKNDVALNFFYYHAEGRSALGCTGYVPRTQKAHLDNLIEISFAKDFSSYAVNVTWLENCAYAASEKPQSSSLSLTQLSGSAEQKDF